MQRGKIDILSDETEIRILSEYRLILFAEARRHCDDVGDAEELVLRTIDAALRNWESCQNKDSPLPWLLGMLKNIRLKDDRRMVERNTVAFAPDVLAANEEFATNETDDTILRNSDSEAVRDAIGRLAPEYKKTVVMHYMMDMPLKEIAKVLRHPIGTVKWRLSVAKGVLAGMLKRSLGRPGTWVALAIGLLVGCTTVLIVMRFPPRKSTDPVGGIAYNTPKVHEITVRRAPADVKIDGDLSEWTPTVFDAVCDEPYDRDYSASIRMMWDEERLYIGGDIRTPDPLRNMSSGFGTHQFAGGSIICRFAANNTLGWPLAEKMVYGSRRPLQEPFPDEDLVSLIMFYDSASGVARLSSHRSMRRQRQINLPSDAWCGVYSEHRDGRGYTFEYAFAWREMGVVPPKPGEMRANTWNIHFSDGEGLFCTGQISENVRDPIPDRYKSMRPMSYCYWPPTWGKAMFE